MSFLAELRRRNVIRVAGLYVVTAWLLIQIAETLLPIFATPDWVLRVLVVGLALGFIPVLVFSWIYELTPEGLKRDSEIPRGDRTAGHATTRKLDIATLAIALLAITLLLIDWTRSPAAPSADVRTRTTEADAPPASGISAASIAVLPFADLSPEGDQAYFAEGISEEILNVLVSAKGLSVASRTSSFQFRAQQGIGIPDIARTLKVRHVLEGSVRKAGERIRITAQLIDAEADSHLWSETFDRTLSTENLFEIQDEIARAIVAAINANFGAQIGETATAAKTTDSVEAYALYLQARTRYFARVEFNHVADLLDQAVRIDPEFTDALAMRGAVFVIAPEYGVSLRESSAATRAFGRELARQALALEPEHPLALGVVSLSHDIDMASGVRGSGASYAELMDGYSRALAAQPNNVDLVNWRGYALFRAGHVAKALEDFLRCREIDPVYSPCRGNLAGAWLILGDLEQAREEMLAAAAVGALSPNIPGLFTLRALGMREAFYLVGSSLSGLRGWHAFDELYDALGDPQADHSVLRARLGNLVRAQGTENQQIEGLLVALGDHSHRIVNWTAWMPVNTPYRRSDAFKRHVTENGLLQYWREQGFPPQCRPVGDEDFACD
ncbi:tetratricopeptide repeat protein [Pseudomarimonas salicorniae]|uniref:TolB amino-terminal domain-containing protein n=1 Tax=Pseudomarimonas salicorniae TaxID=2933270 RepID=A0ABT0GDT8_9GAMM|nr:hypothetical protein [Lysobacter sp. CAU 1642]MCK7592719.1 hypothetical protein [Lysobacter sp. CAU 1642]